MPLPLGLLSAAGVLAALGGRRTAAVGLLAAAGIVDDVSGGPHVLRRVLPHRSTWNVTATAGDPEAEETLVFVAHHDAANGGLIFRPELTRLIADTFPRWYARQQTSPQMMRLVAAGPALAALGALTGLRPLRRLGLTLAAGSTLAFLDIGTRTVVPGANDNLTAVAVLLELARAAARRARAAASACCSSRRARRSRSWRGCAAGCAATGRRSTRPGPAWSCSRRWARRS